MKSHQIGQTEYYFSSTEGKLTVERKRVWAPFVYAAYMIFPLIEFSGNVQWRDSLPLFLYIATFPIVLWVFFKGSTKTTIGLNHIEYNKFFGLKKVKLDGEVDVSVEVSEIGGRYPHKEIRLVGKTGTESILLALVKGHETELHIFDRVVREFQGLKNA